MAPSSRAPWNGPAKTDECQRENQQHDGEHANHLAAITGVLPMLQCELAVLLSRKPGRVLLIVAHCTILRAAGYSRSPLPGL